MVGNATAAVAASMRWPRAGTVAGGKIASGCLGWPVIAARTVGKISRCWFMPRLLDDVITVLADEAPGLHQALALREQMSVRSLSGLSSLSVRRRGGA